MNLTPGVLSLFQPQYNVPTQRIFRVELRDSAHVVVWQEHYTFFPDQQRIVNDLAAFLWLMSDYVPGNDPRLRDMRDAYSALLTRVQLEVKQVKLTDEELPSVYQLLHSTSPRYVGVLEIKHVEVQTA